MATPHRSATPPIPRPTSKRGARGAAKGLSLHIGLNHVDPDCYQDENGDPWDGELAGCINDARDMQAIAVANGFRTTLFTDDQATSGEVVKTIAQCATELSAGDTFFLTYSGHGGQTPDVNGDDEDGMDETWCLFDRQLLDDELYNLWSQFEAGVRIIVLSDSCHSGTVLKQVIYSHLPPLGPVIKEVASAVKSLGTMRGLGTKAQVSAMHALENKAFRGFRETKPPRYHNMPLGVQRATYLKNKAMYDAVQWAAGRSNRAMIGASVLLISGCQDNQLSADGDENGLFTQTLLEVWKDGAFEGNYQTFADGIIEKMPGTQTPNYYKVGAANAAFEDEKPFSIGMGSSEEPEPVPEPESEAPEITADADSVSRDGDAPSFSVATGTNQYYVVEVASDYQLFVNRPEGNTSEFYATYYDEDAPDRETSSSWTLPESAWEAMKEAERLYFRIGTTPGESGWDPYIVSTEDGAEPPSLEISGVGGGAEPEPEPESEAPEITADADSVSRDGDAPSFSVSTGTNQYYVVEVASDYQLFVSRPEGNTAEFYATYYDQDAPDRETSSTWTLPESAWEAMKEAERLYFRIGTTPGESGWDPYIKSTEDGVEPPSLEVTAGEGRVPPKRAAKAGSKGTKGHAPLKTRYGTKAATRAAPPRAQTTPAFFGSSRSREQATSSSRGATERKRVTTN